MSEIVEVTINTSDLEQGTISSNGNNSSSSTRIRTINYIDVSQYTDGFYISILTDNPIANFNVMRYNASKSVLEDMGWIQIGTYVFVPSDTKFIRLVFRKSSGDISVSDVVTPLTMSLRIANMTDLNTWTRVGHWNRFNNDFLDNASYLIFNLQEHEDNYKRLYRVIYNLGTYEYHLKISIRTPSGGTIQNENNKPKIYIVLSEPTQNSRPISYYGIRQEYEIPLQESSEFITYDINIPGSGNTTDPYYVVIEFTPFVNDLDMVYYFQNISFRKLPTWVVEDGELVNKLQIEPIEKAISKPYPNLLMRCDEYVEDGYPFNKMYIDLAIVEPINPEETFDPIKFLQRIRVRSTPHGLNKIFPITKMSIPLDDPGNTTYNLGSSTIQSMTSHTAEIGADILKKISDIPPPSSILQAAKDNASELIKAADNGYVTIRRNSEGLMTEILICDRLNYLDPDARIWRWNINGLGYSSTGYNGEFGLAMTMDGSIVADRVTTGIMSADRIRGGNLIMGGLNNIAGTIIVNDENGNPTCVFNKAGGMINGELYTRATDGIYMNLAEGHLYGGHSENGSDVMDADINLNSRYDVDGRLVQGLGLNAEVIGLNAKQVWVGNTTIGYMVALPQYETDIVTDVSVTKDGDGKVTGINLTKKHLHFIHGILTQVDNI